MDFYEASLRNAIAYGFMPTVGQNEANRLEVLADPWRANGSRYAAQSVGAAITDGRAENVRAMLQSAWFQEAWPRLLAELAGGTPDAAVRILQETIPITASRTPPPVPE